MHHDAAMQAPAASHASSKEGDPLPCSEDEEIFEIRPDAVDMVKATSNLKFMKGMEKEECTGYNALHKLLQGLPVPVPGPEQKNTSSMTQAESFPGRLFA